ncbi:RNA dependent RNA polymerase [Bacillus sp. KH172YL63]|uniref:RNA dependent RNA polymerase n=1 Tax=Bacillus sp. KH172YL63 TaxID=2709784 RepID=UPI0013E4FBF8|nr:hypothetical protein [Bacillus sp. KH172YL63]BCB03511.1 hypothetical protein KH172YL63_16440 [Bacillus sp. KH172YL63]
MKNNKNKQIQLYSLDTSAFYTDTEYKLNIKLSKNKRRMAIYKSEIENIKLYENNNFMIPSLKQNIEEQTEKLNEMDIPAGANKELKIKIKEERKQLSKKISELNKRLYRALKQNSSKKMDVIKNRESMDQLPQYLRECSEKLKIAKLRVKRFTQELNTELKRFGELETRVLRQEALADRNKISQFQSTLPRTITVGEDGTTKDIIMIRAFRYVVFKSLVNNGFYDQFGRHYQYFTSSAGMVRNKKSIFAATDVVESEGFQNRIWCGLTKKKINETKFKRKDDENLIENGVNLSKMGAYLALCMTSSIPFEDFDIDRAIVVPDYEKVLKGQHVNYISKKNKFKPTEDTNRSVPVNIVDGCGMMLPEVSKKCWQYRMPGHKGLLIPFPFVDFIRKVGKMDDCTVTDIYGETHDIIADRIQYIFTASQFKLAPYYKNWDEYKRAFKKGGEFAICKEEEDNFLDKPISYQMIQTLPDIANDEIKTLTSLTNKKIAEIEESADNMLGLLGVNNEEGNKDSYQKALTIYPELISDEYSKEKIRSARDSLYKNAKSGKIYLKGTKRTFMSPDLYAFAEWLFLKDPDPKGLIDKDEVSCKLYKNELSLDVLRSPHLYKEHILSNNKVDDETKDWFISNCIYMSSHNLDCSNVLMADFDGDEATIVSDPCFKFIAKRNMKDVLPLDYELGTANREEINNENLYNSLTRAYSKNQQIGEISNKITKEWAKQIDQIDEELVMQLVYQTNAAIDFAKTSWYPSFPDEVENKIKDLNKEKLPHFFIYSKDKEDKQVNMIPKRKDIKGEEDLKAAIEKACTVDKLEYVIGKNKISFSKLFDKFDYKMMMKKKNVKKVNQDLIKKYVELNKKKKFQLEKELMDSGYTESVKELTTFEMIRDQLLEIHNNEEEVADMLIHYHYEVNPEAKRGTIWDAFGHIIYQNIKTNLEDESQSGDCKVCKTTYRKVTKNKELCDTCKKDEDRKKNAEQKKKSREAKKTSDTIKVG